MDYSIRKANEEDIHDIAGIYHRSWQSAYRGIIDDDFLDKSSVESRVAKLRQMDEIKEYLYIAGSKTIGCSRLIDSRDDDLGNCAEIQTIYFLPEYTGLGHGKRFLGWLVKKARAGGYSHVIVWCLSDNTRANKAYAKVGFKMDRSRNIEIGGRMYPETRYRMDL